MTLPLVSRVLRGYREIGRRALIVVGLVAVSAALGGLIALPLWLFATASPRLYTAAVIVAAGSGITIAAVRRLVVTGVRWRRAVPAALGVLLGIAKAALLLAGAYAAAAFAAGRRFLLAAAGLVVALAVAAWIGYGASAGKPLPRRDSGR